MDYNIYTYKAKIIDVYDGDTVTAIIDLGFRISFEMKLRLKEIDTPEIRGEERESGLISRDKVRELILNKDVFIQTEKDSQEKYGRYLAVIFYYDGDGVLQSLNDFLVKEGLAELYT